MRESQQQMLLDEEQTLVVGGEETTLVAPRFDDEETLVARPVVPLEAGEFEAEPEPQPARSYPRSYTPRRSWMLALMFVSVLVGGVLGGAGLYFYQRQSHAPSVTTQPTTSDEAPPQQQQAAPNVEPTAQQTPAPHTEEATAPVEETPAPEHEPEQVPAAERRNAPAEGTPKHGKKSNRDEEPERRTTTPPDANVARAEQPQARKVDSIFYRPRRAERRARRGDDVDRVRRIFEGTQP